MKQLQEGLEDYKDGLKEVPAHRAGPTTRLKIMAPTPNRMLVKANERR